MLTPKPHRTLYQPPPDRHLLAGGLAILAVTLLACATLYVAASR